jgi:hypothetical protein
VVYESVPVAGRYRLIDATSLGYTGKFDQVILRFTAPNTRATTPCFSYDVTYDPQTVAAMVSIPNSCGGTLPFWLWIAIGVGVAIVIIVVIIVVVVMVRKRRENARPEQVEMQLPLMPGRQRDATLLSSTVTSGFEVPAHGHCISYMDDVAPIASYTVSGPDDFTSDRTESLTAQRGGL